MEIISFVWLTPALTPFFCLLRLFLSMFSSKRKAKGLVRTEVLLLHSFPLREEVHARQESTLH